MDAATTSLPRPAPLWRGRALVFVGILLVAVNLRTAVAGLAPIIPLIQQDFALGTAAISTLGAIAPLSFAAAAFATPALARRFGLERMLVLALLLMVAGHVLRAMSVDALGLATGTLVALLGMGLGNVLLPPIIKRRFPDRLGLMTALYLTLVSLGALAPALVAVPVSESLCWRASLAQWAVVAVVALMPWVIMLASARAAASAPPARQDVPHAGAARGGHRALWRSPTAVAITAILAVSSINGYAMYAWLPVMLGDIAGVPLAPAGALLALFAGMGAPVALILPILAARVRNAGLLVHVGVGALLVGYAGLLIAPAASPLLWVLILGTGPLLFPLSFVLINLRSRSAEVSLSLSGFAQSIAYLAALLGPPLLGGLREWTGGWSAAILTLAALSACASLAGIVISRGRTVDEELDARL